MIGWQFLSTEKFNSVLKSIKISPLDEESRDFKPPFQHRACFEPYPDDYKKDEEFYLAFTSFSNFEEDVERWNKYSNIVKAEILFKVPVYSYEKKDVYGTGLVYSINKPEGKITSEVGKYIVRLYTVDNVEELTRYVMLYLVGIMFRVGFSFEEQHCRSANIADRTNIADYILQVNNANQQRGHNLYDATVGNNKAKLIPEIMQMVNDLEFMNKNLPNAGYRYWDENRNLQIGVSIRQTSLMDGLLPKYKKYLEEKAKKIEPIPVIEPKPKPKKLVKKKKVAEKGIEKKVVKKAKPKIKPDFIW